MIFRKKIFPNVFIYFPANNIVILFYPYFF
jgi:hypothetical protein